MIPPRTRRQLLRDVAAAGAGLVIAVHLPGCISGPRVNSAGDFVPNAWLRITPESRVVFILDRVEMGQGVMTSHSAIIAEELGLEPSDLEVEFAEADRKYDNPEFGFQLTGGSTSVHSSWEPLRQAGAAAREALISAAAEIWGVAEDTCTLGRGEVLHRETGRKLSFGRCAGDAARHLEGGTPVPPERFRVIGQPIPRLDAAAKSTGKAGFGIDVRIPGMLTAVVIRGPVTLSKTLRSFDGAEAEKMNGVSKVLEIPGGVAVVADSYWRARQAAEKVKVEWEKSDLSSDSIRALFRARAEKPGRVVTKVGWFEKAFEKAEKRAQGVYEFPYLAHATMEPQNCTAHVRADGCEVWAPTQSPGAARLLASQITGLDLERVKVETTFLGGGFGRRIGIDYVAEAVHLSKAMGAPVQVIWSREDDVRHDIYRPGSFHLARAGITDGRVAGWFHRIVGPSILSRVAPEFAANIASGWTSSLGSLAGKIASGLYEGSLIDQTSVEGAAELPYAIDDVRVEYAWADPGVPIGFWRSVGHSYNAFVVETMIDELATTAGVDPVDLRVRLLSRAPRNRAVLELAAEKAGWGGPLPAGRFRGIAQHASFGSYAAEVAEVSVSEGRIRVHKVVAALDCGRAVNPAIVAMQVESAIVYGLSAALFGEIGFAEGYVMQGNFDDYPVLRMDQMPEVEVHLIQSGEAPSGVGEPGVPPIAPAVANALFAATGTRHRRLPLRLG